MRVRDNIKDITASVSMTQKEHQCVWGHDPVHVGALPLTEGMKIVSAESRAEF